MFTNSQRNVTIALSYVSRTLKLKKRKKCVKKKKKWFNYSSHSVVVLESDLRPFSLMVCQTSAGQYKKKKLETRHINGPLKKQTQLPIIP